MLSDLLSLLRDGGTHRISDLARELGTTQELIEAMLEDLARMGHVKHLASQCSETCSTCPVSEMCAAGSPSQAGSEGQMWVLTEGQEAS